MYLYIETSALNRAAKRADGLTMITEILNKEGLRPAIGTGVIYELAKLLWSEHPIEKRQRLFQLVLDLDPTYLAPVDRLIADEVRKLRHGDAVIPFLMELDYVSAKLEVTRFARGEHSEDAETFTRAREDGLRRLRERDAIYVETLQHERSTGELSGCKTFEDVASYFRPKFPELVMGHCRSLDRDDAVRIVARLSEFPVIRTILNAELIFQWIRVVEEKVPSRDKTHDYRHVIAAAYCSDFLSADGRLLKRVPLLNPDLGVLAFPSI